VAGVQAPADRHYRRPDVRPARRRRLGARLLRIARLGAPALVVTAGLFWVGQIVLESRLLAVSRVVVRGNDRLSAADIDALLEGLRGQNILEVDFERYRRQLLASPWIASVTLWRLLPATVEVRVVERVPMALARLADELYLVDRDGVIIDEFGPEHREFDLPIVDGLVRSPAGGGSLVDPDRVRLAAQLLAALGERPGLLAQVSQIDVAIERDAVVLLDRDPVRLHLGDRQFVERLQNYLDLAPALREQFAGVDYVDLRFDERVFVRAAGRVEADAVERRE
jgi:cell division protein FtsQ